nr:DnaA/Hda family protein [Desulfitobacterium dehalogenans]
MMWLSSEFNRMAEQTLKVYEPEEAFFSTLIYGPAGVGKSTLLLKCYKRLKNKKPILYINAQDFVKNYAFAAQEGTLSRFRLRLRTPTLLILDHIEMLKGKTHSIEEFYHTYEALFQGNSRIICGFRGEPSQLEFLGDKLSSRLLGGLAVPIFQPTPEDRLNYLRLMAYRKFLIVEDLVLELMAEEVANFPEAQSLMNGFIEFANRSDSALDRDALSFYLQERRHKEKLRPSPQNIVQKAAELTGIAAEDIYGTTRTSEVRQARQLAIYVMRSLSRLSYPEIGTFLNKSHSSIMKSYQQFQEGIKKSPELKEKLESLLKYFNSREDVN